MFMDQQTFASKELWMNQKRKKKGKRNLLPKMHYKLGHLKFEWSIIMLSKQDWIGLYEDNSKKNNTNWLSISEHWFYISRCSHFETFTNGHYSFTGSHWTGT